MALYKQRNKPPKGAKNKSPTAKRRMRKSREEQQNLGKSPSFEQTEEEDVYQDDNDEEENDRSSLEKFRKNHIPAHGKLTARHVKAVLFHLHHNVEANIQVQLNKCRALKKKINYWARSKLQEWMLSEAIRQTITVHGKLISKFTQIGQAYMLDGTTAMHDKIHAVIYQQFQARPGWRNDLEEEFMQDNQMCYEDEETTAVGFVRALISEQYSELKRGITDRAKKSHGTFVRIRKQPKSARKKKPDPEDGDESSRDDDSMEDDLVDTDNDELDEEKPPKLSKGIFHTSYIRVEKKITRHGKQQWIASPKSRVISSKEYGEFRRLQETHSALQSKLIEVMEQNIKLRNALTAHSIALPADLQEQVHKDTDSDEGYHSTATYAGSAGGTGKPTGSATNDDLDSDSEIEFRDESVVPRLSSRENHEELPSGKVAEKKGNAVSTGRRVASKPFKSIAEKKRNASSSRQRVTPKPFENKGKAGASSQITPRSNAKKRKQILEESSEEDSFSVGDDEEETEDAGSERSKHSSPPARNIKTSRYNKRRTIGDIKRRRDRRIRQVFKRHGLEKGTMLMKQGATIEYDSSDEDNGDGYEEAELSQTETRRITKDPLRRQMTARPDGKKKKAKSMKNSNNEENISGPEAEVRRSIANYHRTTSTEADDDDESFSPEPRPKEAEDDQSSWSVTDKDIEDGRFSDTENLNLEDRPAIIQAGKNKQKQKERSKMAAEIEGETSIRQTTPIDELLEMMSNELDETQELMEISDNSLMGRREVEQPSDRRQQGGQQLNTTQIKSTDAEHNEEDTDDDGSSTVLECDYEHENYDLGMIYYTIEDAKELLFVLQDLGCKLCDIPFGRGKGEWKPGQKTPVFACHGMRCGDRACTWAVCGGCFAKEQLKRVDNHKSVRTRRQK